MKKILFTHKLLEIKGEESHYGMKFSLKIVSSYYGLKENLLRGNLQTIPYSIVTI